MPLRDFSCLECQLEFTDVLLKQGEECRCPACGRTDTIQMAFSFPSNYTISGDNSSSCRPRRMGGEGK